MRGRSIWLQILLGIVICNLAGTVYSQAEELDRERLKNIERRFGKSKATSNVVTSAKLPEIEVTDPEIREDLLSGKGHASPSANLTMRQIQRFRRSTVQRQKPQEEKNWLVSEILNSEDDEETDDEKGSLSKSSWGWLHENMTKIKNDQELEQAKRSSDSQNDRRLEETSGAKDPQERIKRSVEQNLKRAANSLSGGYGEERSARQTELSDSWNTWRQNADKQYSNKGSYNSDSALNRDLQQDYNYSSWRDSTLNPKGGLENSATRSSGFYNQSERTKYNYQLSGQDYSSKFSNPRENRFVPSDRQRSRANYNFYRSDLPGDSDSSYLSDSSQSRLKTETSDFEQYQALRKRLRNSREKEKVFYNSTLDESTSEKAFPRIRTSIDD